MRLHDCAGIFAASGLIPISVGFVEWLLQKFFLLHFLFRFKDLCFGIFSAWLVAIERFAAGLFAAVRCNPPL